MKGKTVVILGGAEGVAWFSRRESQLQGIPLYVIDSEAAIACEEKGIAWEPLERFQDFSDIEKINAAAYALSHNWWQQSEVREVCPFLTNYSGFPLGHLTELPFYHLLAVFARSILTMRRLIENEKPEKLIVFSNQKNLRGGAWISFGLKFHFGSLIATAREEGVVVEEISFSSATDRWQLESLKKIPRIPAALARRGKAFFKGKLSRKLVPNGSFTHRSPYRVLLYAEERHGDVMLPLLEAIAEDQEVELIALTQDLSEHCAVALREKGVPLFNPESFLDGKLQKRIRAEFRQMQALGRELKRRVDGKKLFWSSEIQATLWPHIQIQMDWFFEDGLLDILKRVKIAEKTLDFLSPHLLLTPVDQSIRNLCWIFPAKKKGIPTMTHLHGAIYLKPTKTLWATEYADWWLLMGSKTLEWHLAARDCGKEKYACVGSSLFERDRERFQMLSPETTHQSLGLDSKQPLLLFLLSMTGGVQGSYWLSFFEIYRAFFQEVSKMPHVQIIVRTHPAHGRELPYFFARSHPGRCLVNPPHDLLPLLKVADVVVGQPTTALVEAMVVGKPVLLFTVGMAKALCWWTDYSNLEVIATPSELVPKISAVLHSPEERERILKNQKGFLDLEVGPLDGRAAERSIAFIKETILGREGALLEKLP